MKKRYLRYLPFVILILLILLITAEILVYFTKSSPSTNTLSLLNPESPSSIGKFKKEWGKKIKDFGADKAYTLLKEQTKIMEYTAQHNFAHIFGELLYEKIGINGIKICDSTYAFGCFHGFFGKAIGSEGLEVVTKADRVCVEKYGPIGLGCVHGIGHGLTEFFGHDENKLIKALEVCKKLTWKGEIHGCSSGVFMEYNLPSLLSNKVTNIGMRKFDFKKPYDPCPNLKKFQASCYHEAPQLWMNNYAKNYKKLGELCENITDLVNRKYCYLGVGYIVSPSLDYKLKAIYSTCALMPSRKGEILCRAGASWGIFSHIKSDIRSHTVCVDTLNNEEQQICKTESNYMNLKGE